MFTSTKYSLKSNHLAQGQYHLTYRNIKRPFLTHFFLKLNWYDSSESFPCLTRIY